MAILIGIILFFFILIFISWKLFFSEKKGSSGKKKKKKINKEAEALYKKAKEELQNGNLDTYLNYLTQASLKDPMNPELKRELAFAYYENGFFSKARFELENYIKLESDEKKILEALELIYKISIQNNNFRGAFATALKIIALDPLNTEKLNFVGIMLAASGKYDEGLNYLNQSIKEDTKNKEAYFYRGVIFAARGWKEEAIKEFETAIELGYNEPHIYFFLGLMYREKDKEKSIHYYNHAIKDMQKLLSPDALFILKSMIFCAIEFMLLQEWDQAIKILEEVSHIDVHDVIIRRDLFYNLGFAYLMKKHLNKAIDAWNQLILVDDTFGQELDMLKFNYQQNKELLEKKWYERIKELKIDFFFGIVPEKILINLEEEINKVNQWLKELKNSPVDLVEMNNKKLSLETLPQAPLAQFKKAAQKVMKALKLTPEMELTVENDSLEIIATEKKGLSSNKVLFVFKRTKVDAVGELVIDEVFESMKRNQVKKAILASISPFSEKAKKKSNKYRIKLVGPEKLKKFLTVK